MERPGQIKMQCNACLLWSMRMSRNNTQYPLQNPSDEKSSATVVKRN